ncbi:hypothetical protein Tco_0904826 [Tanacetum coccineum]
MVIGMQYLNTNSTLYEALLKADKDQCLTREEVQRVARDLCDDFETIDFFDVELEEGLEEGLGEVQGQLELDELHSMEEVQVRPDRRIFCSSAGIG